MALGTLYRRFGSKEELLIAALELVLGAVERDSARHRSRRDAPRAVSAFFEAYTDTLCGRPNLARAVVRSTASGHRS